jgi:hypothetical protein
VRPEGSDVGPNQLTGGGAGVTVNVEPGAVQVDNQADPALEDRLRQVVTDAVRDFILTGQQTDPGASGRVQGAGRTG